MGLRSRLHRYPFLAPSTFSMSKISQRSHWALCLLLLSSRLGTALASTLPARLVFDAMPDARFEFQGSVGDRIKANVDNWLLRAPGLNRNWEADATVVDAHDFRPAKGGSHPPRIAPGRPAAPPMLEIVQWTNSKEQCMD